ncbi:MAG: TonB-dependent receptor [Pseudoxanthomonas sp.]
MKTPKPDLLCTSIALALALVAGNALASETDADEQEKTQAPTQENVTQLEALTVTARGVKESLQKAPLSITAISKESIEKKGLVDMRDIANQTPGFSLKPTFGRWQEVPVIRGMSNIGTPASTDISTNASLFIDGIYVNGDMSTFGLENVERVEVLRGPQAAAFGRSTFAGAINFITSRPGSRPGGKITLGAGNYGQEKLGIYYSGGTDDGTFGYEASINKRGNDSIFYNAASGKRDLNGSETFSYMGAVAWSPTENLDIVARATRQKTRDEHVAITLIGSDKNNCYLPVATVDTTDPSDYMQTRSKGYYCGNLPLPEEWSINTQGFLDAGLFPGVKSESDRYSLKADYSFDNGWKLESTSAYNTYERYYAVDQSYQGIEVYYYKLSEYVTLQFPGALATFALARFRDKSQSLRLSSDYDKPLAGLVGAYYYKLEGLPGYSGSLTTGVATPSDPGNTTVNKSVYGQIRWQINDKWTTSLEARYSRDNLTLEGVSTATLSGITYTNNYVAEAEYSSFTPRWTLSYQLADNINLYGLVSKGNKPGGFNTFVYYAGLTDEARAELIAGGYDKVKEEEVTNYELGFKSDWLENTLRFNASLYQLDWKNQGLSISAQAMQKNDTLYTNTYVVNVGKTRIRGLELESQWAFAPGWLASLVYAFTDSEILEYSSADQADLMSAVAGNTPNPGDGSPLGNLAGHKSPLVPRNKFTLGLAYDGHFANGWDYGFNWDTTYEGDRYLQVDNLAILKASWLSNFRMTLSPSEAWKITAYVNNVFDDDSPQSGLRYLSFDTNGSSPYINIPAKSPSTSRQYVQQRDFAITAPLPRMYGIEVSYSF